MFGSRGRSGRGRRGEEVRVCQSVLIAWKSWEVFASTHCQVQPTVPGMLVREDCLATPLEALVREGRRKEYYCGN